MYNAALSDPTPYNPDQRPYFRGFDPAAVPSPCFVIDRAAVEWNLRILRDVAACSGATMLLALKAFAPPPLFTLIRRYMDGACASGVYEARLARYEIGGNTVPGFQVHTYAPAYSEDDLTELLETSDHLIFNSLTQWVERRAQCLAAAGRRASETQNARPPLTFGLRVNPECSLGAVALYDPCAPASRLGITAGELERQMQSLRRHADLESDAMDGITELHFHTLCESDSHALATTLQAIKERFGYLLENFRITRLNMGGGHHITRPDYDRDHLVRLVQDVRERYAVDVILEPGEAAAIHTGILVTSILDLPRNGLDLAILDTSATAHMPDTLEMPYRPEIWGSGNPKAGQDNTNAARNSYVYRIGGQTCLAGDVIGDYSFRHPLHIGDRLVFDDMSHYTMVKTTTFNGVPLPSIAIWDSHSKTMEVVRRPAYRDFRERLG